MQTPWGDIPVSDAHVHFFSHRYFSLLAAQRNCSFADLEPILGWTMPPEQPEQLANDWVQEMITHGVARAAIIASIPTDESSVDAAVRAYPKRFYGYFMINPTTGEATPAVEKALAGPFLQGICFFPAMHRYSMHDERVLPLLEMASSKPGTVIFVHCGVLTVGIRRKLGLPSPFDMRFSNPLDIAYLAHRFPTLSFVIPHFGGGMFREALMLCDLCPNAYLDTSSTNSWVKYQEPGCDLTTVFRRSLEIAGPQRLLFGSDSSFFPRGWQKPLFDQQVEILHNLGVTEPDARAILGENLQRLLSRG